MMGQNMHLDDYHLSNIDIYGVFPPGSASSKKLRLLIDYLKEFFAKVDRHDKTLTS